VVDTPARPSWTTPLPPQPTPAGTDVAAIHRKAGAENFTVASLLLPPRIRRRLLSVYAFARLVDDIGDEAPGDRNALLDKVDRDIDRIYAGYVATDPLWADLTVTVHECGIPRTPLDRLVQANRRDQVVKRYRDFADLLGYCELSANPVGHLVLHVFDAMTPERAALSDKVCSALQVLEHLQDVAEDNRAGRIYLPSEDLERFGVKEADLAAGKANREVRALIAFETQRTLRLLDEGAAIVGTLSGLARLAVAGYVAGGRATAAAIVNARFDVLTTTPRPRKSRTLAELVRSLGGGR
jgi:squalene synthase HpnC